MLKRIQPHQDDVIKSSYVRFLKQISKVGFQKESKFFRLSIFNKSNVAFEDNAKYFEIVDQHLFFKINIDDYMINHLKILCYAFVKTKFFCVTNHVTQFFMLLRLLNYVGYNFIKYLGIQKYCNERHFMLFSRPPPYCNLKG